MFMHADVGLFPHAEKKYGHVRVNKSLSNTKLILAYTWT